MTVNVFNQGEPIEVTGQRQRRGPGGEQMLDVMVKSSVQRLDARGELDGVFQRHGAARRGNR